MFLQLSCLPCTRVVTREKAGTLRTQLTSEVNNVLNDWYPKNGFGLVQKHSLYSTTFRPRMIFLLSSG